MLYAIIIYNSTIHTSTDFALQELVLGHTDTRDPMNLLPTQVFTEHVKTHQNNTKALYQDQEM